MIQLPLLQAAARSLNEDGGKGLRDPPPPGMGCRWIHFLLYLQHFFSSSGKETATERERRRRDLCLCVDPQSLQSLPGLFQSGHCAAVLLITSLSHFTGILDLHENYRESKSFMCHMHSLQHIFMITLYLNLINYSTCLSLCTHSKLHFALNCMQN